MSHYVWDGAKIDAVDRWFIRTRCEFVVEALRNNRIQAFYVDTKEDARKRVLEMIPEGSSVGVSGSVTIRELGLIEALEERGHQVFHHWKPGLTEEESIRERKSENSANFLLTSTNAVTLDGKLINSDSTGNKIAGILFGPSKVILVAGYNKIVKDVDDGIWRIKNVVTPMNSKRHGRDVPCAHTTFCVDCSADMRQDVVTAIIERKPWKTDLYVVLVGEDLGF